MYTYQRLTEDLSYLTYCGVDVGSIGGSVLKNAIPYAHVGDYSHGQVIITGGIHARENVSSLLVMRQAFRVALSRKSFEGGIYFLPMLNPDGALLIEKGLSLFEKECPVKNYEISPYTKYKDNDNQRLDTSECGGKSSQNLSQNDTKIGSNLARSWLNDGESRAEFLARINGGEDFSLWKANINGVDLNNNFDAKFGEGIGQKTAPASQGYPGAFPFSQPETAALKDFTLSIKPALTLSYHALGQELYWYFFQSQHRERDLALAQRLQRELGYTRVDTDGGSTGGYKDWCIQTLKIPAFTVEIVSGERTHPLSDSDLEADWEANKNIPYLLAEMANSALD